MKVRRQRGLVFLAFGLLLLALSTEALAAPSEYEQLAEKLYNSESLTPEDQALLNKAAKAWGETEEMAAKVIVKTWLEQQLELSSKHADSGESGSKTAGAATESWFDHKLIALALVIGAAELIAVALYYGWWRRRHPWPWFRRPENIHPYYEPDEPASKEK